MILEMDVNIVPEIILYGNSIFKILYVHEDFIIEKLKVKVVDDIITNIYIGKKHHPNAINLDNPIFPPDEPSDDTEFCLDAYYLKMPYSEDSIRKIIKKIKTWNYLGCHWKIWDEDLVRCHEITKDLYYMKISNKDKQEIFKGEESNVKSSFKDFIKSEADYLVCNLLGKVHKKTNSKFVKKLIEDRVKL